MIKKYTDGKNIVEAVLFHGTMSSIDECVNFVGKDNFIIEGNDYYIKTKYSKIPLSPTHYIIKDEQGNISISDPKRFIFNYKEYEDEDYYNDIVDELHNTYKKKNHDYGNSFSILYRKFGLKSTVIRLWDKLLRLETLLSSEAHVNESIRDTLMDMANYCIMTVMELDQSKEKM